MESFDKYCELLREHDMLSAQEFDYLDTIDLERIIKDNCGERVYDVMERISQEYEEDYLKKYQNDEGLFNTISEHDFMWYIHSRYGIRANAEIRYYF